MSQALMLPTFEFCIIMPQYVELDAHCAVVLQLGASDDAGPSFVHVCGVDIPHCRESTATAQLHSGQNGQRHWQQTVSSTLLSQKLFVHVAAAAVAERRLGGTD
jgi:hypothetical protein